jgi:hypothetical protein
MALVGHSAVVVALEGHLVVAGLLEGHSVVWLVVRTSEEE